MFSGSPVVKEIVALITYIAPTIIYRRLKTHKHAYTLASNFRYNWHHHWNCCCSDMHFPCLIDLLYSWCLAAQTKTVKSKTTDNCIEVFILFNQAVETLITNVP